MSFEDGCQRKLEAVPKNNNWNLEIGFPKIQNGSETFLCKFISHNHVPHVMACLGEKLHCFASQYLAIS